MKKLYIILFILLFSVASAQAENIKKIYVSGNDRVSAETIILFGGVNIDDNLEAKDLNKLFKDLYTTNFFSDVKISFINGNLSIKVIENPLVQIVEFEGVKNKRILEVLKENIQLKEKTSFVNSVVKKDEEMIENILRSNGYYFTKVVTKIIDNNNNTINLKFDISLGDKAFISKIKFIGDKKLKDRKLKNIIVSEEAKFWKFISRRKYLDLNRIRLDENLLKNYYKNNGYYNAVVTSSSAQVINDTNFELVFNINAGEKFYFHKFELNIPNDYNYDNFSDITNLFQKLEGKIYSLNKIEKILKEIDNIALTKEYEFIHATYNEVISENNKINLQINLTETEKTYVERINLYGNFITEEKVIRNSLIVDEGDAFNEILLNKSINNIKSRNIFKNVSKTIQEGSSKAHKIINIEVEEKPTGEISAGAGTGTSGSVVSVGIKENNYLGRGIRLNTNLSISNTTIQGLFSINNPNFKNSDKSLNTTVESTTSDYMSRFGYKNTRHGFSIGTYYEQFKDIYFSPSISNYYEILETSSSASTAKKKQEGSYIDSQFKYGLTLNKLNQNFHPSKGYRSSFNQTLPIYSDDFAITNSYEIVNYFSFNENAIFSFNFFIKAANSLTGEDVRITKRVFIPGRKLRGFEHGKIGPVDGGDYIGGNYGSVVNLVTSFPNLFPELQDIDFNIFVDAANLWGVDYDSGLDKSKVRSSTGIGIDWFTPIGPLSFSFATPLSKADTDKTETFRFNIGTTF